GPWGVWNPHTIWVQVVLISGISFMGYLAMKIAGPQRGASLSGILGGFASSTAVMLTFSRRSKETPELSGTFIFATLGSSVTSVIRIFMIVFVVDRRLAIASLLPLLAIAVVSAVWALVSRRGVRDEDSRDVSVNNPFELRTAFEFAVFYAAILLVTSAASEFFGTGGIYVASLLGGLLRPDAIALSLTGPSFSALDGKVVVMALTLAIAVNSVFKAFLGASLGSPAFRRGIVAAHIAAAAAAILVAWLVPPLAFELPAG
ncbi:MAG TPA: DUF4010 domain-containing protein, partial [Deinococcales bacterium]|nr:DUF4010 domain-containing protein [Deinococcales bacterium]